MNHFPSPGTARLASGADTGVPARSPGGTIAVRCPITSIAPLIPTRLSNCCDRFAPGPPLMPGPWSGSSAGELAGGAATLRERFSIRIPNCCGGRGGGRGQERGRFPLPPPEQNPQVPLASEDAFLWQVPGNAETAVGTVSSAQPLT